MKWQHISERPELIPKLARWLHDEWGYYDPQATFESRCQDLWAKKIHNLPMTIVGTKDDELLGSYSLTESDLSIRPELSPWLASVYINPAHRNLGIGTMMVKRSMEHALSLGFQTIYLFTNKQARWYGSMGWQLMEETIYKNDERISIMSYALKKS